MTKISIIVPVYNSEEFIAKTLESLVNQTHKNIEILCVNDGSTDKSLNILQEYAKKYSCLKIFDQPNSGPAVARNTGLVNATSPYIMFCDSDDYYELDMCEIMLSTIEEKNVDFVMCNTNIHKIYKESKRKERNFDRYINKNSNKEVMLTDKNMLKVSYVLWNKIFKKDILEKYKITLAVNSQHDDMFFILQYMLVSASGYYITNKLYNYIIRNNSIMENYIDNSQPKKNINSFIYGMLHFINFIHSKLDIPKSRIENMIDHIFRKDIENFMIITHKDLHIEFLQEIYSKLINKLTNDEIKCNKLLTLCKEQLFSQALQLFTKQKYSFKILGLKLYSHETIYLIKKIKLLNIQILRINTQLSKPKIHLFGIRVF